MTARAAAIVLIAATAAGCGGGPSAEETRAELRRWASAVDDICHATQADIATRGYAEDLVDLQRVTEHASADVRGAIERIRDVPLSKEARPRVRAFLAELEKIEPRLSDMTGTTVDGNLKEIGKLGLRLADATQLFQRSAESAGLRECADTRQFDAVLDTFTAPVYATQIARLEHWLARAVRRVGDFYPPWSPQFARHVRRVGNVLEEAERRLGNLLDFKPNRAVEAGGRQTPAEARRLYRRALESDRCEAARRAAAGARADHCIAVLAVAAGERAQLRAVVARLDPPHRA